MNKSQQLENLIRMANQIADNFPAGNGDESETADHVANHIRRFWARSMKADIQEYVQSNGDELNPIARAAVVRLGTS